jgi:deazaflavin-dependent oxidoreductase (nitroreductase family)
MSSAPPAPGRVETAAVWLFSRTTARVSPLQRWSAGRRLQRLMATDLHVSLYRLLGGSGPVGRLGRGPLLLLTTTGRRSGKERTTPVIYIAGEDPAVIGSNGGGPRHAQWYLNLRANPRATIEIGREKREVVAELAEGDERRQIWEAALDLYPGYDLYESRTDRDIPVVVLRPAPATP